MESVRLSEVSAQVTAALADLDAAALEKLRERLTASDAEMATRGAAITPVIEPEPVETVERQLRILEAVLNFTGENIQVLRRLQERKARQAWAL